jgi:PhzF family phenazine biosynthesis protein
MGNPVGVCLDGAHLSSKTMQLFAQWTNLSETTFIIPPTDPEADYRVRIFTPSRELPFAGHPTLGSCYAWLHNGGSPRNIEYIVQECGIGLVKLRRGRHGSSDLSFEAPEPIRMCPMEEEDVVTIAKGLGIDRVDIIEQSWCDNGPKWRGVMLASMDQVLKIKPNNKYLQGLDVGVIGPVVGDKSGGFDYEVRAFCDEGGSIVEDPVTGSLNAALAQWLMRGGIAAADYMVRQGTMIGRDGRVKLSMDEDRKVWVSGCVSVGIDGTVHI